MKYTKIIVGLVLLGGVVYIFRDKIFPKKCKCKDHDALSGLSGPPTSVNKVNIPDGNYDGKYMSYIVSVDGYDPVEMNMGIKSTFPVDVKVNVKDGVLTKL